MTTYRKTTLSIGLLVRNEQERLPGTLASLFRQTLFEELSRRGQRAEIWCVANGCTDDTAAVAERIFRTQSATHPYRDAFAGHAVSVTTPGKVNAWNLFVHEISSRDARSLILMDGDILIGHLTTLWNLHEALDLDAEASVTVGRPVKDIALKRRPTIVERLSLATSRLTAESGPQLTGQLYCIRASVARHIRLPRDLGSCEDGFIKNLVCTDFLQAPGNPARLKRVEGASHVFEAYVTATSLLRNQKRQMMGQTCLHVLLDRFLPAACRPPGPPLDRLVQDLDATEPDWLRALLLSHVREARHFWRLFPSACTFRIHRWLRMRGMARIRHLPATVAGVIVSSVAAWMAHRALRRGLINYWPTRDASSPGAHAARLAGGMNLAHPAT